MNNLRIPHNNQIEDDREKLGRKKALVDLGSRVDTTLPVTNTMIKCDTPTNV